MGGRALTIRIGAAVWAASVIAGFALGALGLLSFIYLLFAGAALASTWREGHELRLVGIALIINWSISNAWSAGVPGAPHEIKATIYTMLEIFVALVALAVTLERLCWTMVAIVSAAAFSTAANVIYAATPHPAYEQVHLHEVITNICFALECVFAVWAGWRNCSERTGRIGEFIRPFRYRRDPQHHGAAASPAPGTK